MEAVGASDSRAQLSECNQDVALSPKKKRKVGNPTVAETKKMYFTIQVHYGSNNDKRILTHLNFAHIIHSALNSMFGIVGEALYPYKVVSYDPQTQLGTVETLAETGKEQNSEALSQCMWTLLKYAGAHGCYAYFRKFSDVVSSSMQ